MATVIFKSKLTANLFGRDPFAYIDSALCVRLTGGSNDSGRTSMVENPLSLAGAIGDCAVYCGDSIAGFHLLNVQHHASDEDLEAESEAESAASPSS
jgi:hypothetical protein